MGTAAEPFFNELLRLFGYADKSGVGLLDGTLNFRYCTVALARTLPVWCQPVPGDVALLITIIDDIVVLGAREAVSESLRERRDWVDSNGEGRKRFRPTRNPLLLLLPALPPDSSRKWSMAADSKSLEKVAHQRVISTLHGL